MGDRLCKGVAYDNVANIVCCGSKRAILNYLTVLLFSGIFVLRVASRSYFVMKWAELLIVAAKFA
jgi:hypothetical protein